MTEGVWCFIVCFGSTASPASVPLDTYCGSYERIVLTQEELNSIKRLPKQLRNRIQGNDLDYLCRCQGWRDVLCQKIAPVPK